MRKILIVDDDNSKRKTLLTYLGDAKVKANILEASDGLEGLSVYNSNTDLREIVTDLDMPRMNGYDFIKKLREEGYTGKILVNSASSSRNIREAIILGATNSVPDTYSYKTIISFLEDYFCEGGDPKTLK